MSEETKCFIIQPLSEKYKERCDANYKPAIEQAGLDAYRVDEHYDPTKLKIQVIEDEIQNSSVCLADITEDNPNVWYEVGFAYGHGIPVVLVCENAKRKKLPFDVNQRDVCFYKTASRSDWDELQGEITKRLKIAVQNKPKGGGVSAQLSESDDVELFILWALHYGVERESNWNTMHVLQGRMERQFEQDDITDAFRRLESMKWIRPVSGGNSRTGEVNLGLTDEARDWCLENKELVRNEGKKETG
ncbi:MAG: hypothetical protein ACR2NQ_04465 [Thermodesulfobacteriota bacterium]